LYRQFGKIAEKDPLALNLFLEPVLVLLERAEEVKNPRLPVRFFGADRSLSAP
jgi:hypothetical protein